MNNYQENSGAAMGGKAQRILSKEGHFHISNTSRGTDYFFWPVCDVFLLESNSLTENSKIMFFLFDFSVKFKRLSFSMKSNKKYHRKRKPHLCEKKIIGASRNMRNMKIPFFGSCHQFHHYAVLYIVMLPAVFMLFVQSK